MARRDGVALGPSTFQDVVLASSLAPKTQDIVQDPSSQPRGKACGQAPASPSEARGQTRAIVPKTPYLQKMVDVYKLAYVGKQFLRQPRIRRDAGVRRSQASLEARAGQKTSEAQFQRRREKEISGVMAQTDGERKHQRSSHASGAVPEDTGRFVTEAVQALRGAARKRMEQNQTADTDERAAKRQKLKQKAARVADLPRWAGKRNRDGNEDPRCNRFGPSPCFVNLGFQFRGGPWRIPSCL